MQVEISVITCHHKGDLIYGFIDSVKQSLGVSYEIIVITSDDELALKGIPSCLVLMGHRCRQRSATLGLGLQKANIWPALMMT